LDAQRSETGISIILPVRNEERMIERNIKLISDFCAERKWDFELLLSEDNSMDSTVSIIKKLAKLDNRIKLISSNSPLGKGGAIMAATLNFPLKDFVAYMDMDLSAHPSQLQKLIANMEGFDLVVGSRLSNSKSVSVDRPFYRTFLSTMYSRLFRILFRIPVKDPQCGLKLFRKDKIYTLFDAITIPDFAFDTDLIVAAFSQNLRIKEVPIDWQHVVEESKVRVVREIRSMMLDLISIWAKYHLIWTQGKNTYPQKKGTILGKWLFAILSHSNDIKKRNLEQMQMMSRAKIRSKEIMYPTE
jgi:glycosyltransferase involved in cell wall biosynthesis